jgi:hypothetical protein
LPLSDLDRVFWVRVVLGAVGGASSELLFGCKLSVIPGSPGGCVGGLVPDYSSGILYALAIFLGSYYFIRLVWGKKFTKEQLGKVYTTGIGTFALLFLFFWILLFTLGVSYLNL